jgi:copper chaperone NosL
MKAKLIILVSILFCTACSINPEPLKPGKDQCHACKMPVADIKYGAEIVTNKGKVYKFDDIICLLQFYDSETLKEPEIHSIWVSDFEGTKGLIDVNTSCFLLSEQLQTPMNSQAVAFADCTRAELFLNTFPGKLVSWQELIQRFK